MSNTKVEFELTQRESQLVLKYGYLFPDHQPLFEATAKIQGWSTIEMEEFWLQQLIGDLSISTNEATDLSLQEELNEICETLELAIERSKST
ncbi:MAG: hypothetical protein OEY38_20050 [Gammaproteobacteria bacterium]|nr:hypothetical protein [Gammaproteobacteria bacterium]